MVGVGGTVCARDACTRADGRTRDERRLEVDRVRTRRALEVDRENATSEVDRAARRAACALAVRIMTGMWQSPRAGLHVRVQRLCSAGAQSPRKANRLRLRPSAHPTPLAAGARRCCCRHGVIISRGLATAPPDENDTSLAAAASPGHGRENERGREQQDEDTTAAVRITGIGSVVNLVLSAAKGGAGVACGSSALIADAVHSLSDLASDAATVASVRLSRQPADHDHPYGHGRYETVGALTVSGMVALSGLGIGAHSYEAMMTLAVAGGGDVVAGTIDGAPMPVAAAVAAV